MAAKLIRKKKYTKNSCFLFKSERETKWDFVGKVPNILIIYLDDQIKNLLVKFVNSVELTVLLRIKLEFQMTLMKYT